jgi:hypothetical protein
MKLIAVLVLAVPLTAGKSPLVWTPAVVESRTCHEFHGRGPLEYPGTLFVRESTSIDAGEWLYCVNQAVDRKMARLRAGDKIEVAVDGRKLLLRIGGKRYTTYIEKKTRADKPVTSHAAPR